MESLNASDVKLFAVKVTQKWMGVNGMLTQVKFCYKMAARGRLQLPVDFLAPWKIPTAACFLSDSRPRSTVPPADVSADPKLCDRKVNGCDTSVPCAWPCVCVGFFSNSRQDGREDSVWFMEVRTLFSICQRKRKEHNGKMHTLRWWKASDDRQKFYLKFKKTSRIQTPI